MTVIHLIVLALVQGITEFLPVSSSAHLIVLPNITGWPDQGLAFDVAAHVGTLVAVVVYFRNDLVAVTHDCGCALLGRPTGGQEKLGWAVVAGTIPVGLAGLLAHDFIAAHLRSPLVIATTTIVFGLLLWAADRWGQRSRALDQMRWRDVVWIGCAQALALIPGTSRSGATMSAALALGMTREAAARFSFLMSIPVIVLAGGFEALKLSEAGVDQPWGQLGAVVALSAISAFAAIHLFLRLIERIGMGPFVIYRLLLGVTLLWLFAY